jgi:hypothetical protein
MRKMFAFIMLWAGVFMYASCLVFGAYLAGAHVTLGTLGWTALFSLVVTTFVVIYGETAQ